MAGGAAATHASPAGQATVPDVDEDEDVDVEAPYVEDDEDVEDVDEDEEVDVEAPDVEDDEDVEDADVELVLDALAPPACLREAAPRGERRPEASRHGRREAGEERGRGPPAEGETAVPERTVRFQVHQDPPPCARGA